MQNHALRPQMKQFSFPLQAMEDIRLLKWNTLSFIGIYNCNSENSCGTDIISYFENRNKKGDHSYFQTGQILYDFCIQMRGRVKKCVNV